MSVPGQPQWNSDEEILSQFVFEPEIDIFDAVLENNSFFGIGNSKLFTGDTGVEVFDTDGDEKICFYINGTEITCVTAAGLTATAIEWANVLNTPTTFVGYGIPTSETTDIIDADTTLTKIDGTRPFTATVAGVDPVAATDLTTRQWTESAISAAVSAEDFWDRSGTLITTQNANDDLQIDGYVAITDATASTSTTTGALVVTGGVGIGGDLHVYDDITAGGSGNADITDFREIQCTREFRVGGSDPSFASVNGSKLSVFGQSNDIFQVHSGGGSGSRRTGGYMTISGGTSSGAHRTAFTVGTTSTNSSGARKIGLHSFIESSSGDTSIAVACLGNDEATQDPNLTDLLTTWKVGVAGILNYATNPKDTHIAVYGKAENGITNNYAGYFDGLLQVNGDANFVTGSNRVDINSNQSDGSNTPGIEITKLGTSLGKIWVENSSLYLSRSSYTPSLANLELNNTDTESHLPFLVKDATASTSTTSGALVVTGGVGIGGDLNLSQLIDFGLSGDNVSWIDGNSASMERLQLFSDSSVSDNISVAYIRHITDSPVTSGIKHGVRSVMRHTANADGTDIGILGAVTCSTTSEVNGVGVYGSIGVDNITTTQIGTGAGKIRDNWMVATAGVNWDSDSLTADTNIGVYGYATGGTTNWAGYFEGDVKITGAVTYDLDVVSATATISKPFTRFTGSTASQTLTFPAGADGLSYTVKNSATVDVTLDGDGSEEIEGSTTFTLTSGESALFIWDNTNTEWVLFD